MVTVDCVVITTTYIIIDTATITCVASLLTTKRFGCSSPHVSKIPSSKPGAGGPLCTIIRNSLYLNCPLVDPH